MAQFRELEAFSAFASDLDAATRAQLERGKRLVEALKQPQYSPLHVEEQVVYIFAATNGFVDSIPDAEVVRYEKELLEFLRSKHSGLLDKVKTEKKVSDEIKGQMKSALEEFAAVFKA